MKQHSICAVVPVYNAAKTLDTLVDKLISVLTQFAEYSIVLVDDHSADDSYRIMKQLQKTHAHITIITLAKNAGQQSALLCGLRYSKSDYTVIIDDDLENNPEDIVKLYERILHGFDVVYGVRKSASEKGVFRDVGSKTRDRLINRLTSKPKDKKVCSFRLMNAKTVQHVVAANTAFVYISLEILSYTTNIENVAVDYSYSHRSGYNAFKLLGLLIKMYIYYSKGFAFLRRYGNCYEIKEALKG